MLKHEKSRDNQKLIGERVHEFAKKCRQSVASGQITIEPIGDRSSAENERRHEIPTWLMHEEHRNNSRDRRDADQRQIVGNGMEAKRVAFHLSVDDSTKKKKMRQLPMMELVDNPEQPEIHAERRLVPRISTSQDSIRLDDYGRVFALVDISVGGFSLKVLHEEDLLLFSVGRIHRGVLRFCGDHLPVQGRVSALFRDRVGFEFFEMDPADLERLKEALDPVRQGQSLKLWPPPAGVLAWYRGGTGVDLILTGKPGAPELDEGLLIFFQNTVQWSADTIETGHATAARETPLEQGVVALEALSIVKDEKPDPAKLAYARALLGASSIQAPHRLALSKVLKP